MGLITQWVEEEERMTEGSKEKIIAGLCFFSCSKGPKIIASPVWNFLFSTLHSCLCKTVCKESTFFGEILPRKCSTEFTGLTGHCGNCLETRIYLQWKMDQKFLLPTHLCYLNTLYLRFLFGQINWPHLECNRRNLGMPVQ